MARTKTAVRKKGNHSSENMLKAVKLNRQGMSLRKAAKECNVCYPTLFRYVKKHKNVGDALLEGQKFTPNYDVNKTFTDDQESALKTYIKDCALKFYGLSSKDVRRVAYQMAIVNGIKYPDNWQKEQMAGKEWLRSFKSRHPDLSMKKPEACSLARATAFNKETVKTFFNNLKTVMDRYPSFGDGTRVFNLDETATTTVQKPQKVLAPKGKQNIGKVTSGERGTLVTTCAMVCAAGQALPPVLVFPRKNYKDIMLRGAHPGSLGLATPTGWMNAELFVHVMRHFIKHTSASRENPALLICDNHESHLSIEALNLAKESGVSVLTLHPHTTAKMQPLDVGLNGPFKVYYNSAVDSWLMKNPGKPITIYNVAECVGQAYTKSMTPTNIASAFKKCGIFPYDADIFTEIDFMPSSVTDRDEPARPSLNMDAPDELQNRENRASFSSDATRDSPSVLEAMDLYVDTEFACEIQDTSLTTKATTSPANEIFVSESQEPGPSIPNREMTPPTINTPASSITQFKTPDEFMPALKAVPRTGKRKARKLGKSMVATDTPEKDQIAEEKKKTQIRKSAAKAIKRPVLSDKKRKTKPKQIKIDSETSTDEDEEIVCYSETDLSGVEDEEEVDEDGLPLITESFIKLERKPKIDDYVLVLMDNKKLKVYYVAQIIDVVSAKRYEVSFLRLKVKDMMKFQMPLEPDISEIHINEIKKILPPPQINGTKTRNAFYNFPVRVSPNIKLR